MKTEEQIRAQMKSLEESILYWTKQGYRLGVATDRGSINALEWVLEEEE